MKKIFFAVLILSVLISCKTIVYGVRSRGKAVFQSVQIDTVFQDKISIRAMVFDANKVWYAANDSRFGFYDLEKNEKFESRIVQDSLKLEFRSIAKTANHIYILSVSDPALLYQVSKDGAATKLVYRENHEKVFYDSMQFWNDTEGIAIGDPIDDCLSMIVTRDGGNSWSKIPSVKLPKVIDGEAAFAASNTNIAIKGNNTWVVSGGKKSSVFYSPDRGNTWEAFDTPIVQGKQMTGIFTADFHDAKNGYVAGGDYEAPNQNSSNKAATNDGGKTWKLMAENQGFGFASCVQYVPNSRGKSLVTVGASGLWYSSNSGNSWKQLASDPSLFTIRFLNDHTAIAAGKNKMIRISFKK